MADFRGKIVFTGEAAQVERLVRDLDRSFDRLNRKAQAIKFGQDINKALQQSQRLLTAGQSQTQKLAAETAKLNKRWQQFTDFIFNAAAALAHLTGLYKPFEASITEILKDTQKYNDQVRRSFYTLNQIDRALAGVSKGWRDVVYSIDKYDRLAARQLKFEDRRRELLNLQENAMRRQLVLQGRLFAGQKQLQNVRASRTGRETSGFLAFSQAASSVTDVDRAARRKRARTILQESDELQRALQRMEIRSVSKLDAALGPATDRAVTKANDLARAWDAAGKAATKAGREAVRAADKSAKAARKAAEASRKALQGRLGSAAIGGAFPLLFGQSGLAAVGGLIGGAIGGQAGGFAGSLVGTLVGDLINTQNEIRELAREMGLGVQEAELLGQAFRQAGADADKFRVAVQNIRGVGFAETDEFSVIRLASKLTDDYGGKVDKVTQGFANIATTGKSSLSDIRKFTAQGIPVLARLERNLGLTRSQLLKLAQDGGVSAQQTADALVDIANAGRDAALATKDPWFDTWKSIKDNAMVAFDGVKALLAPLGRDLDNAALKISQAFAEAFEAVVGFANAAAVSILNAFAGVVDTLAQGSESLTGLPLIGGAMEEDAKRLRNLAQEARDLAESLQTVKEGAPTKPIARVILPGLQPDPTKDGSKRRSRVGELTAELQLARELLAIEQRMGQADLVTYKNMQAALDIQTLQAQKVKEIAVIKASDIPLEEKKLKIAIVELETERALVKESNERVRARQEVEQSFRNTVDGLELELQSAKAITREELNRLAIQKEILALRDDPDLTDAQKQQIIDLKKELQDAQQPLAAYRRDLQLTLSDTETQVVRMAQTIEQELGSAMSSAVTGLVTGTQTVEQAMATMFENIGKAFIDMATQMIAKAIILQALGALGGGGGSNMGGSGYYDPMTGKGTAGPNFGLADGGSVNPDGIHLVGERGPELFVPGQAGMVVPNDIFEATRQALASGGGTTQAFEENSEALATSNSYIRERVLERDRQMMLTGAGGSTTVQTQIINSVEYATIDQVQQVADLSAKKARAQVFADMRNKPSTRASLGMG